MLRKILTSSLLSLVIVGGFFVNIKPESETVISFVDQTYAADCGGTGQAACTSDQEMVNMFNKMIGGLNIALDILSFIVTPAIMLAGWLMSPDWTSGDLFNLRPVLHDLWVLVSNITYFIYALLLIFIALATIFNSQNYGYKKLLPRLALGIILVPLTWWFVQFIISLSTIVTASVMNMPTDVMDKIIATNGADTWWTTPSIPKDYEFYTDDTYEGINGTTQYNPDTLLKPQEILSNSSGIYGALIIYGNGLFKFNELKKLSTTTDVIQSISSLVNKGLLGVVMFVVFGFLVIALIFMLMMRAIKLWFYAIFSPLLTLRYVVGKELFGGGDNADSFEIKEFVGLAFVPALVGLALSFGIVVIAALQGASVGTAPDTCTEAKMQPDADGCKILGIMGSNSNYILKKVEKMQYVDSGEEFDVTVTEVVFGGVSFKFYGSIVTNISEYAASASTYNSVLSATGSVFGTLIIDMIALIFLWSAFMAAKNVSKVAKAAFEPFEKIGRDVGRLALSVPKYTPIPGTGGLSIRTAEKTIDSAKSSIEYAGDEQFKKTRYARMFGAEKFTNQADMKTAIEAMKNNKSGVFSENRSPDGEKVGGLMVRNASKEGLAGEKAYQEWIDGIRGSADNSSFKAKKILMAQGIDETSAGKIGEAIVKGKNMADREMVDLIKGMAQSSAKGPTGASLPGINAATDGKGFNIGTININESLSSDVNKIAAKLKTDGVGGGASMAGRFTADEFRSIMQKADQFAGDKNKGKLDDLISKLGSDYFKKADAGTPPAPPATPAAPAAGPTGPTASAPRSTDQFSQENWTG